MGIYDIPIQHDSVLKAVVTDDNDVIADNLKKLKSSLKIPVVVIDLKINNYLCGGVMRGILVLSSRTFCLLVSLKGEIPKSVKDFTNDRTICFVATISSSSIGCGEVRLGNLAARVLKKPSLNNCRSLETLAGEVGVELRQPPKLADENEVAKRGGILFSQEEMEFLIQNAYYTFVTAEKLLGSLGE